MKSIGKSLAMAAGFAMLLVCAVPAHAAEWIPGHWAGGRFIRGHHVRRPHVVVVKPAPRVIVRRTPRVVVRPAPTVVVPVR